MINKDIKDIDEKAINDLVTSNRPEDKTIEYKLELPRKGNAEEAEEFLRDVSAFANTSGGDIIYGIQEKEGESGMPDKAVGLEGVTGDAEQRRLEDIVRTGLAPPLTVHTKRIPEFPKGPVIVFRIPPSFSAPHMITHKKKGDSRFYVRTSTGRESLAVEQIRLAFIASENLSERIRNFRAHRLSQIIADETPVLLEKGARFVVHLIPLAAFHPTSTPEIVFTGEVEKKIRNAERGSSFRYNFDGYLAYSLGEEDKNRTYLQVFRRGEVEYVDCNILGDKEHKTISYIAYEEDTIGKVAKYLNLMKDLRVETPLLIMISLLGVKDWSMGCSSPFGGVRTTPDRCIDRDVLMIPARMIEDYDEEASHILKPVFDTIWQACGFPYSSNYDKNGVRIPGKSA